jgi:hypothetical protein
MDWIKRNLFFVLGGVAALALMGMAGYFLYSKWQLNNSVMEQLDANYNQLRGLNMQDPHPGSGDVNNIDKAKQQTEEVRALIKKARAQFKPIPPIPDVPKLTDRDFSTALARTLEQMQRDATNASVTIPANYLFSFATQNSRVTYAAGSLEPLATQLGEVKAIAEVLFAAKVNSIDLIRREKVSPDDQAGAQTDYLEKKSITNELAILSPYEIVFRCFSSELAAVLSGFASSPSGLNVKAVNVELAPSAAPADTLTPFQPAYIPQSIPVPTSAEPTAGGGMDAAAAARFRQRYGIGGGAASRYGVQPAAPQPQQPQTVYLPQPTTATASKGGLQTVLDEKQLKVTLMLTVVKLIPPKEDGK